MKQAYDTVHKTSRAMTSQISWHFCLSLTILKTSRKHPHLADVDNESEGLSSDMECWEGPQDLRPLIRACGFESCLHDNSKFISEGSPVL